MDSNKDLVHDPSSPSQAGLLQTESCLPPIQPEQLSPSSNSSDSTNVQLHSKLSYSKILSHSDNISSEPSTSNTSPQNSNLIELPLLFGQKYYPSSPMTSLTKSDSSSKDVSNRPKGKSPQSSDGIPTIRLCFLFAPGNLYLNAVIFSLFIKILHILKALSKFYK